MKNNENWIIAVVVVLVVLLFGSFGFGMMGSYRDYGMMGSYRDYGMMGAYCGGYGYMGIFMMLIWALVIIALVLGIMWLIRQLQNPNQRNTRRKR
ncbi:hypothetical protein AUJ84_01070 [Candidatus Pacearchaeota archaeon CG1_02_32_132]|nr:MAG: hypothetical protein AUJ84_01070 [Candidatus Pacearchaeota archaeon CG1_02_32_132]